MQLLMMCTQDNMPRPASVMQIKKGCRNVQNGALNALSEFYLALRKIAQTQAMVILPFIFLFFPL